MSRVETVDLGAGVSVSRIAKGNWQLAEKHGAPVERARAIEDMRAFVEAGITLFDCADHYVGGAVEERDARLDKGAHVLDRAAALDRRAVPLGELPVALGDARDGNARAQIYGLDPAHLARRRC